MHLMYQLYLLPKHKIYTLLLKVKISTFITKTILHTTGTLCNELSACIMVILKSSHERGNKNLFHPTVPSWGANSTAPFLPETLPTRNTVPVLRHHPTSSWDAFTGWDADLSQVLNQWSFFLPQVSPWSKARTGRQAFSESLLNLIIDTWQQEGEVLIQENDCVRERNTHALLVLGE